MKWEWEWEWEEKPFKKMSVEEMMGSERREMGIMETESIGEGREGKEIKFRERGGDKNNGKKRK